MKITFTAGAAEIAEQESQEFLCVLGVLGGSCSEQPTEALGELGGFGG